MKVALRPPDDRVLKNLQIGPDTGLRWDIMEGFCAANAACVSCGPTDPNESTTQLIVQLLDNAPTERLHVASGFINPQQPWEDVDADGKRYFRICRAAGQVSEPEGTVD